MKKSKKTIKIFVRSVYLLLTLILLVTLPLVGLKKDENLEMIYGTFVGKKSKYQGMIEIWNIDSFEGGSASKTSFLKKQASVFQKQNKGLYVFVRNLSEQECLNLLMQGEKPDLFSCSYGVASELKSYLEPFSVTFQNLLENFAMAGKVGDKQYAVPWCFANYFLISSKQHLMNAKIENIENVKLKDIALSSGYVKKGKKNDKTIYSLGLGAKKYLLPNLAFMSYTNNGLSSISDTALLGGVTDETPYSVYSKFIAGDISVLFGSNRDVFRVLNRVGLGKMSDVIIEPATSGTDLIQFLLMSKCSDEVKRQYVNMFAKSICEAGEKIFDETGLFSCEKREYNKNKLGVMQDITLEKIRSYKPNNIFLTKSEIEILQQKNQL